MLGGMLCLTSGAVEINCDHTALALAFRQYHSPNPYLDRTTADSGTPLLDRSVAIGWLYYLKTVMIIACRTQLANAYHFRTLCQAQSPR
jgi:hypothetical protein